LGWKQVSRFEFFFKKLKPRIDVLNSQSRKVAGSIRMSAAKRLLSEKQSIKAETCANYLTKNQKYMDYKTYLLQGYPIAFEAKVFVKQKL
jgi:hypothetical protein